MSASKKLSTATRALCYLAEQYPIAVNSSQIAEEINVNASKLRKILSYLVKTNIVESTKGTSGGFLLKKEPSLIHLQEVYCAVEDRKAFHLDVSETDNEDGVVFNTYFMDLFGDIQIEIEEKMRGISLQNIMDKLGIVTSFNNAN